MLALWEYFWNEPDWVPAPPPPAPPIVGKDQGSGKGHGPYMFDDYVAASPQYWEAREEYLKKRLPKPEEILVDEAVEVEAPQVIDLIRKRKAAIALAKHAATELQMINQVKLVSELTLQIASLRAQYDEEALLLLLLSL